MLQLAPATSGPHPYVRTATTLTIPMRAHHAAITVPVGSLVASLSVLGHGTAATMDPASTDPAFMGQDGMGGDGMVRAITHVADMLIALALADSVDS